VISYTGYTCYLTVGVAGDSRFVCHVTNDQHQHANWLTPKTDSLPDFLQKFYLSITCDGPKLRAYVDQFVSDKRYAWIVQCPILFNNWGRTLNQIGCNEIEDVASSKMWAMGATVLHEFMHWDRLARKYASLDIIDWNLVKDPGVGPPSGYGA
jgi:hypothetical protein